jgi:hypothetical protein
MPTPSVSTASAFSLIGALSPGSQTQIESPIAAPNAASVSTGTSTRCTKRPGNSPAIQTTIEPPIVAISGESAL